MPYEKKFIVVSTSTERRNDQLRINFHYTSEENNYSSCRFFDEEFDSEEACLEFAEKQDLYNFLILPKYFKK